MKRIVINNLGARQRVPITILHQLSCASELKDRLNSHDATARAAKEWRPARKLKVQTVGRVVRVLKAKQSHNVELANRLLELLKEP